MRIQGFKDTIAWYDANAEAYARQQNTCPPIDQINKFYALLPRHPHILEAGCASGRESAYFIKKNARVVGVDLSKNLLRIARRNNPRAKYIRANFLRIPKRANVFDGVFAHAALVHLETIREVRQALREFYRVVKPGGIVYVRVKKHVNGKKTAVVSDTFSGHKRFFRYFTLVEMKKYMKNAGLAIIKSYSMNDGAGRAEVKWIVLIGRKPLDRPVRRRTRT